MNEGHCSQREQEHGSAVPIQAEWAADVGSRNWLGTVRTREDLFDDDPCFADVLQASLRVFLQAAAQKIRMAGGVFADSVSKAGSFVITNASISDTSSPANTALASEHLK